MIKGGSALGQPMASVRDYESDIDHLLARLERRAAFADILAQCGRGEMVRVDRQATRASSSPEMQGAAVRVWAGTKWVEAATSDLTLAGLEVVADALERALESDAVRSDPPGEAATTAGNSLTDPPHPAAELGFEGMIRLAKDVRDWSTEIPSIRDSIATIGWHDEERLYVNTAGARCYQSISRVRGSVAAVAVESGKVEFDFRSEGGVGGIEWLDFLSEENVRAVAESARSLLTAPTPPTGPVNVLLDPGVTGIFAHESFGHGTEADQFVRDRSYLKPILGQPVGPEFLTIVDNGAYPGGWGSIYYDDEGHSGQRTVLVDRGRFVGALHDRETAAVLRATATGNTRRSDFTGRPFVRMTNTYVEPGDWSLDELVKEAKDGVLLEHASSGIEDPLGGQMQLKVQRGRLIERGELTQAVTSMALSGRVLDFLRGIRGIGKSEAFSVHPGFCGKGHSDILPAGTGGSYLLSSAVVGPA